MTRLTRLLCACLGLLAHGAVAHAHLMESERATVNVIGDSVFCAIAVPVSSLRSTRAAFFDGAAIAREHATIVDEISHRFVVTDDGIAPVIVSLDVMLSPNHDEPADHARNLIVLLHARFPGAPHRLAVRSDLFAANGTSAKLDVLVTEGSRHESFTLTPEREAHACFVGLLSATSALRAGLCLALVTLAWTLSRRRQREQPMGFVSTATSSNQ